jgi:CheY-like chemotaxis protein
MEPVTILLAEDNLVLGLFVKSVLQKAGYRVWFCMDTAEAWQYYADKNPDLVLLDDNQPMKNYKLVQKIRGINKIVPIMYLSGKTFEEELFDNTCTVQSSPSKQGATQVLNEKKLLKHVHEIAPVAAPHNTTPAFNEKDMRLCSAEDILILTTYFEDSLHLRQYGVN